jgi:hypothetical protein
LRWAKNVLKNSVIIPAAQQKEHEDYIACKAWIIANAKSKADLLAGPFADFVRTHKRWANAVLKQSAACPKAPKPQRLLIPWPF